ncbi:MAG: spore coat protein CotJB [Ruminococcus sp.]|nr:spore coat protein CotJB [Ruminococcus sp.]
MNEQNLLLNKIKKYDFALKELNLYLDTHPDCRRALDLFNRYLMFREKCLREYTERFGPIVPEQNRNSQHWDWIDGKWPWERR